MRVAEYACSRLYDQQYGHGASAREGSAGAGNNRPCSRVYEQTVAKNGARSDARNAGGGRGRRGPGSWPPRDVGREATRCWRLACAPGGAGGRPGGRACDEWSMRVLLCVKKSNYICAVSVDGGGRAFEPLSEALTDPWGHALKMSTVRTARNC